MILAKPIHLKARALLDCLCLRWGRLRSCPGCWVFRRCWSRHGWDGLPILNLFPMTRRRLGQKRE